MNTKVIFNGTSKYYAKYRPEIPDQVAKYIINRYKINNEGTLLDMGCGTGISTRAFSPYFQKTFAFDVNAEMLQEAIIADDNTSNIEWINSSDKDIVLENNSIDLAIACRSFNWMDQYPLLQKLHGYLKDDGVISIIGDGSFWTGQEAWQKKVKEVIQIFLGQKRKAGKGKNYNVSVEPYTMMLEKNGYIDIDYKTIQIQRTWTINTVIGYLYSTSFSAWDLYNGKNSEFEKVLTEELISANHGKESFIEQAEFVIQSGRHKR